MHESRFDELLQNFRSCGSSEQVKMLEQQLKDEYLRRTAALEDEVKALREEVARLRGLLEEYGYKGH